MKIAIFSDCYLDLTGGIVTTINAEKAELERRGHTVYVFSSAYPVLARPRQSWQSLISFQFLPVGYLVAAPHPLRGAPKS